MPYLLIQLPFTSSPANQISLSAIIANSVQYRNVSTLCPATCSDSSNCTLQLDKFRTHISLRAAIILPVFSFHKVAINEVCRLLLLIYKPMKDDFRDIAT